MLALGLGTFLITTLYIVQHALLAQIAVAGSDDRPNFVLVDVQTDQIEGVSALLRKQNLPVIHHAPIVTMRLKSIKGKRRAPTAEHTTCGAGQSNANTARPIAITSSIQNALYAAHGPMRTGQTNPSPFLLNATLPARFASRSAIPSPSTSRACPFRPKYKPARSRLATHPAELFHRLSQRRTRNRPPVSRLDHAHQHNRTIRCVATHTGSTIPQCLGC